MNVRQPRLDLVAAISAVVAVLLGMNGWIEYHREHLLKQGYALVDAEVIKTKRVRARYGGCSTRVWVKFQIPNRSEAFHYRSRWNVFSDSSPIRYLDSEDDHCAQSRWRAGDTIRLAYSTNDPWVNRPYYGSLARGSDDEDWKFSIVGAMFFGCSASMLMIGHFRKKNYGAVNGK